jgi:hypothetical protein
MSCQETKWTLHDGLRQCTTPHTSTTETNPCSIRSNSLKRKKKLSAPRMSNIEEMPHGCHHGTVITIIRSNKLQERQLLMNALGYPSRSPITSPISNFSLQTVVKQCHLLFHVPYFTSSIGDSRTRYMILQALFYTLYSYWNYQIFSMEGHVCIFSAHLNLNPES